MQEIEAIMSPREAATTFALSSVLFLLLWLRISQDNLNLLMTSFDGN